jgi:SAM-dependent methyltransferase
VAKKIKFESFVYRFLSEAEVMAAELDSGQRAMLRLLVERLTFRYESGNAIVGLADASYSFSLREIDLYRRGDASRYVEEQRGHQLIMAADSVREGNAVFFRAAVMTVARGAGMQSGVAGQATSDARRLRTEETFHDEWAANQNLAGIDVRRANEAVTSPEMRYIRDALGDLRGKTLLDVGCGLGEASVYFAMEGAAVTAMDISQGMLDATSRLAASHGVSLRTHKSAAEATDLGRGETFDVIYAGNLLHHVDIKKTVKMLKPHLAQGGMFVSWDPLAYNPVINVYRTKATAVRTPDEHPLKWQDIQLFPREFKEVRTKYFWLSTLLIFVVMAMVQRRDPNKERFWKSVVAESDRWALLYRPLSVVDRALLKVCPPLRLLCWNIVIIARNPN